MHGWGAISGMHHVGEPRAVASRVKSKPMEDFYLKNSERAEVSLIWSSGVNFHAVVLHRVTLVQ